MKIRELLNAAVVLTLTSCATIEKGTLLGAAIGGGTGLAVSASSENTSQQKVTGLAIGALVGGVIGYFASKDRIKKSKLVRVEPGQPEFSPKLRRPEVRRVWVPDQINGEEYEQGHWKYLIQTPSVWTKED